MMGLVFNLFNESTAHQVEMTYVHFGDTLTRIIPSIKTSQYFRRNSWDEKNDLEFRVSDSLAYLGLKSFESRRERKYKRGINSFFKKVERKGISHVVIDVRGNRGGYVLLLEHVLSYINAQEKTFDLNYLYKRSKLDRFETLSRLKKIDFVKKAIRVYPQGMISKEYDFYKSPMGSMSAILYQKQLRNPFDLTYTGKCTLITDGLSMSASVLFASWFKDHNRGQLFGTPCFGSMQGTHGNTARIVLENSGIPITISTLKLSAIEQELIEVLPDQKIQCDVEDLIWGRDPFTELLKDLKND
jgi:C-terminal processing protease CtpA/Prc